MADVTTQEDVALPADAVWDVIGGFGAIRKWASAVERETLETAPGGALTRIVTLGGRDVREPLVTQSQYSYTYTVEGSGEADYRGTVAVIPLDPGTTRIVLITHKMPTADETEQDIVARYERFMAGNLKAMKRALGV